MSESDYYLALILACVIAIAISLPGPRTINLWERIAAGFFNGFGGFMLGLMILTQAGNIYLNAVVIATIVSLVSRKTWR
jgi:uncharacterized membrane protein YjjP (DUF1212 family)